MLTVTLLGGQAVSDGASGASRPCPPRTLALLAFLVLHAGLPQTRTRVAALFWPDSSEAQALTNLRRELHDLRRVLGRDPSLQLTPARLCWVDDPSCAVDVRRFEAHRQAALAAARAEQRDAAVDEAVAGIVGYTGELLPGAGQEWLVEPRRALERDCVELCDLVCRLAVPTGRAGVAVDAARRRIRLAPLEEVGYRSLMELQASLGDRAGAVSTYHHCASVLEAELGVEPDEPTRALLHRLLAGGRPPVRSDDPGRARTAAGPPGMVGRAAELAEARACWRAAAAGAPRLLLVRGEAGVGKTRLLAELGTAAAADGGLVATARSFGSADQLAYAPVADWLRSPALRSVVAGLEPVWRAEVERLVPAEGGPVATASSSRAMVDAWRRSRFFEGLARALVGAGRPTLLVLDDVHWCDQETLAFVLYLLAFDPAAPLLVAGSVRTGSTDPEHTLPRWLSRVRATQLLTEVALQPLGAGDTAALARSVSGERLSPVSAALLQASTGGFPLYVVEAVRSVLGGAELDPDGDLRAVLRHRLAQSSTAAQDVAGLAAAAGRDVTLDLLVEAGDLGADEVVAAVDELWRRRILVERHGGYAFSHDLLRDTAYDLISPPRRWLLHRRIAQGLELLNAEHTDQVAGQLAEQYVRAGRPDRAVPYFRRAAEVAAARFAHAEATRLHRRALALVQARPAGPDRDALALACLEGMSAPLFAEHGYASPQVQAALEEMLPLAERLGRTRSVVNALVGLWASRYVQGQIRTAHEIAGRARALTSPADDLCAPAEFAYAGSATSLGRHAEALEHFAIACREARGRESLSTGARPDVQGRAWAAHAHWLLGDQDAALGSCAEAIALARRVAHPYSLAIALAYGAITFQLADDGEAVLGATAELTALSDRYSFAYYREWALVLSGWAAGGSQGAQRARTGIDHLRGQGARARMPYWLFLLAELHRANGRPADARAVLDAALADGAAREDVWWLPEVVRARARYDSPDVAVRRLASAVRLAQAQGSVVLTGRARSDLLARGGDPARAGANALRTVPS